MTDVGREEHLGVELARQESLRVGHMTIGERRVYDDLVLALLQLVQLATAEAEAPILVVIRGTERDPVRVLGVGVEVGAKLGEGHRGTDRDAVPEYVQVRAAEVDDALAGCVRDPCIADVPLTRQHPVEHLGTARDLCDLERYLPPEDRERLADAVSGKAPADRVELAHEAVQLGAERVLVRQSAPVDSCHARASGYARTVVVGIGTTNRQPNVRTCAICSTISSFRFQGRIKR